MTSPDRRLLLVHAHPDDESINNGATMAKYVAEGAHVTLVTCTLGDLGEVLVPELAHLAADRDDTLGAHRAGELAEAMRHLGVTDHRVLGGPGHYRDSGMQWDASGHATAADETGPDAFWHADLTEAADHLVAIIREVRPQVLVTYDQFGNYGHPDHVQANRVSHYAADLAGVRSYRPDLGEPWEISKLYWTAMSASRFRDGLRMLRDAGDTTSFEGMDPDHLPPFAIEDADLDAVVDAPEHVPAKLDAMRAHATQITPDGAFFAMGVDLAAVAWGAEHYRLARGRRGPVGDSGLEEDLFAGL
ncbi:1D-myo-inosityl-2-acetamido-2-deoxy-alpha-D-glucopyranoside deacetylase [Aeromicrobium marinum DSM 15272]|uniref:1D-myo-inositol 2-acetamido-2-deoxy-alpha-D-glucopyranoside deacetylase n=1 Tax=Aeromicrobium marinum DSM 15272 TaxID=585531 RepID=E2SE52_9ACTN|nr:N-acetyl-1-D-myo-inositol-2-amino-2-deoxy-alpha-D-glucopyranoside deacetylase [Aeromicrobium marinum]EFQ82779.1 1D-myo-inosityl-2-acetamido-2-deoxy-alpha-D-glucopyranoside deacetylase [Aeromicrobium marinum DSM 15272]